MKKILVKILKKLFDYPPKSVSRVSLDIELKKQFKKLKPGIVLDVGAKYSPYTKYIPFTKYMKLDIDPKFKPDVCSDIHKIKWESNYFNTVVATEILEHLYDPQKAINEIHRILKPDGECILSTRFIFKYHPDPKDYYRFTKDSLEYLFKKFKEVKIYHHGNRMQVIWQIISDCGAISFPFRLVLNPLIGKIYFKRTKYPCGFVIYAKK